MTARMLPVLCFALALTNARAQTSDTPPAAPQKVEEPKPAAAPAARETPPDTKAYTEASRIMDPEKRIAALEKFKTDFPDSAMLQQADMAILGTLVTRLPGQTARIRELAAKMYGGASEKNRGSVASQIADEFLTGNILLKDAESYARKGVDSMRLASYLQEQMAAAEKRKQRPPAPQELEKRFKESRAARVATLGRVEVQLGHVAKGRKMLEEAYAVNASDVKVQSALGELAVKDGNDSKALELLIPARLSGRATKTASEALEAVYRKQHKGSLEGFDAMLDAEYRKRYPNPVKVEAYKPTAKRSDRVVLAEVFTGSGCPPCAAADLAFDAAMQRYSTKDLAVVMYHQHIPRPDPMTNPDTQGRAKSYGVNGVPTFAIDGKKTVGGGPREMTKGIYDRFDKDLEKDLETPVEAHLTVGASVAGSIVKVRVTVKGVQSESKDLKLQIALVEKELRFNGENGIRFHPMVVRAMGGAKGEGFALGGESYDQRFDLDEVSKALKAHLDDYEAKGHRGEVFTFAEKKYKINPADLAVVVFVQDDKTKHVLQAGYVDLSPDSAPHPVTEANGVR
jgi:thiol-disulfide isomerase/thioredoxin